VEHLQDALEFGAIDATGGSMFALPAQLKTKRLALARNCQPFGEFGCVGA
jgi:hypothetical protein